MVNSEVFPERRNATPAELVEEAMTIVACYGRNFLSVIDGKRLIYSTTPAKRIKINGITFSIIVGEELNSEDGYLGTLTGYAIKIVSKDGRERVLSRLDQNTATWLGREASERQRWTIFQTLKKVSKAFRSSPDQHLIN